MWIIGHRGAAGTWPENTLLSIGHALDYGVDWIEIDIRMVDNTFIVLHDEMLERTTDGFGSLYRYSLSALRRLDAGHGERIPLLTEVMDLIDARAGLNIEIKQSGLTQALVALSKDYIARQPKWRGRLMLSSFAGEIMMELSAAVPAGCLLGALSDDGTDESLHSALKIGAFSLNISLQALSIALVQQAHNQGLKILVYTVNDHADITRCCECAVDGIFTDFPQRAIAFLQNSPMLGRS
ncbi:MAG: glycerophosphoryl diester phosphodiesterase [Proteobacteria bacterium]|nr:MAG: glycerophosphoryl diester phosphodiesterase [Pseudomonadota bacterium]TDJ68762.1 MAG: glycerophosphoryl diester phosphodiesterase [Pseudomonadota bacterium]